jgi:hypothetical protein
MNLLESFTDGHVNFFIKQDSFGKTLSETDLFTDGVRVIKDNNTGLYWEVKSPLEGDVNYCKDLYTFDEAQKQYTQNLNLANYGGYNDWRMPNKDELRSILDYGLEEIAIDTSIFENIQIGDYWTKNVYKLQPYFGWVIFLGFGSGIAKSMDTGHFVMAVRGGNDRRFGEPDMSRFIDNKDDTITDETTGLMWQKHENQRIGAKTAEKLCSEMTLGGYKDWRLPNLKELSTIMNLDETSSSWFFDQVFPTNGVTGMLHYSSSSIFKNYYAWVINFTYGYDGYYGGREAPLLFRAVRTVEPIRNEPTTFVITHTGETTGFDLEGHQLNPSALVGCDANRVTVPMAFEVQKEDLLIRDKNTHLIWDIGHENVTLSWEDALDFIKTLNRKSYGGYTNWRLPDREELRSIVQYDDQLPAINSSFYKDTKCELYWTAQEDKTNSLLAWGIYFGYGCAIGFPKSTKACIRPVCGNTPRLFTMPANERFVVNANGTVTDKVTSFMWMQEETPLLTLYEAFDYCEKLELAGFSDWHLPNMKELSTLINLTEGDKWFYEAFFPNTNIAPQGFYMASTTFDGTFGWGCNFQFGFDGYYADRKNGKYPFRPVRKWNESQ